MADADSLVGGRYGTLEVQLLRSPMYGMLQWRRRSRSGRAATCEEAWGSGGPRSSLWVWHCAGSLWNVELYTVLERTPEFVLLLGVWEGHTCPLTHESRVRGDTPN